MSAVSANPPATNEFRLAAACAAWPPTDRGKDAIRAISGAGIDWPRFLRVVERHRIGGLAYATISAAGVEPPEPYAREMLEDAQRLNHLELFLAYEAFRLQSRLIAAGFTPVVLKGVAVALAAFGRLGLRCNRDIDILVPWPQLRAAAEVLTDSGYVRIEPPANCGQTQLEQWLRRHKDLVFQHPDHGAIVELHGRLFDNRRLLADVNPCADPALLPLAAGAEIRGLRPDLLLIYLGLHGAQHAWSRLKWLADFGALLAQLDQAAVRRSYETARSLGVHRALAQGALLASSMLGATAPDYVVSDRARDRRIGWLEAVAASAAIGDGDGAELEERRHGTTAKNVSHYLIAGGLGYWLEELGYDLSDDSLSPVPASLAPLRLVVRPAMWAWSRLYKARAMAAPEPHALSDEGRGGDG